MGLDVTVGIPAWVVIIIILDTIAIGVAVVQMFPLLDSLRRCVRYFRSLGIDESRETVNMAAYPEQELPDEIMLRVPSRPVSALKAQPLPLPATIFETTGKRNNLAGHAAGFKIRYNYFTADGKGPFKSLHEFLVAVNAPEDKLAKWHQYDELPPGIKSQMRRERIA